MNKSGTKNIIIFLVSACILIGIDQITKYIAGSSLLDKNVNIIDGFFYFELVHNRGAAFGILADARVFFCVITILFALILFLVNIIIPATKPYRPLRIAVTILFSGAVGNLIDRIKNGYVIDYIAFDFGRYSFPRFNVADIYVCTAAVLLFVLIIFYYSDEQLSVLFSRKGR